VGETATRQDPGQVGRTLPYAALAVFTLLGFFFFPGHTWLQQDSQIYVAIFEHLRNPGLLDRDPVATHPHVTYTLFDEAARVLREALGTDFHLGLTLQQIALRWAGLIGVFLLALRLGLNRWGAVFAAASFGLGAVIFGPSVLTVEYEPVPRGFALPLLLLACGYAAHERWRAAGLAAALATLYHPPTTAPFWLAGMLTAASCLRDERARQLLAPLAGAAAILVMAAHFQQGEKEAQILFGFIDPELERLQRWRASYNWPSLWPGYWLVYHPLLGGFCAAALWRLRERMDRTLVWLLGSLGAIGLGSVAVQYVLLEQFHWTMIVSFQPGRGVLFCTVLATVLGTAAAWHAPGFAERLVWMTPVFLLPVAGAFTPRAAAVGATLAVVAAALRRFPPALPALACAAIFLFPTVGQVNNYPALHTDELRELAEWARKNTEADAVFFFAGANHDLAPGIFRVRAQRAIYVDWKGGGQVNLLREFGLEWWRRWQAAHPQTFSPDDVPALGALGIDFLVLKPAQLPANRPAVFRNARYVVIRTVLFLAEGEGGIDARGAQSGK